MSIAKNKIEQYSTGVEQLADQPKMTAAELKAVFDGRTNKEVKNAINGLVEALLDAAAASELGAKDPYTEAKTTVQAVLMELAQAIADRVGRDEVYTKEQTNIAINNVVDARIVKLGAGDMAASVYDPQGKATDIFAAVENRAPKQHTQEASTVTGGVFPEVVAANDAPSTNRKLMNVEVRKGSPEGELVSAGYLIAVVEEE